MARFSRALTQKIKRDFGGKTGVEGNEGFIAIIFKSR